MKKEEKKKIVLVFLVAFSLRVGISSIPPLLPLLQKQLQISDISASLLTSVPVLCMGAFALLVPYVQKIFGRARGISVFLLVLTLAIGLRLFFTSYLGLLFTAFFIGLAVAIIGPLLSGYIKREFPARSGLLIGVYSVSMGLGASISSGSVTRLSARLGGQWSAALAFFSCFALIGLISWKAATTADPLQNNQQKKASLPLKNRQAWTVTLFFGIQSGIFYGMTTWISTIAYERGLSLNAAGYVLTFYTLTQMMFSFIIPLVMDYRGQIRMWAGLSCFLVIIGTAGLLIQTILPFFLIAVFFIGVGLGGLFPIALLLPIKLTSSADETSSWTGMVQSFGYMIGGAIPIFMGAFSEFLPVKTASLWFILILSLFLFALSAKINIE
jgi:CP family cyanate transporter-like MFS transporter